MMKFEKHIHEAVSAIEVSACRRGEGGVFGEIRLLSGDLIEEDSIWLISIAPPSVSSDVGVDISLAASTIARVHVTEDYGIRSLELRDAALVASTWLAALGAGPTGWIDDNPERKIRLPRYSTNLSLSVSNVWQQRETHA